MLVVFKKKKNSLGKKVTKNEKKKRTDDMTRDNRKNMVGKKITSGNGKCVHSLKKYSILSSCSTKGLMAAD